MNVHQPPGQKGFISKVPGFMSEWVVVLVEAGGTRWSQGVIIVRKENTRWPLNQSKIVCKKIESDAGRVAIATNLNGFVQQ